MNSKPFYVGRTFLTLKRNLGSFIRFEIMYKVISVFIFFPLMEKFESSALRLSGVYYLSNYNLSKVLHNPIVWLMGIISVIMMGIFVSIELLALCAGAHAMICGKKLSALDMFEEALGHIERLIRSRCPSNILFILYAFLLVPFIDMYDAISIIGSFSFFGYFFARITRKHKYVIIIAVLLILLFVLSIVLIYTTAIMVAEKKDFIDAAKKSIKLVRFRIPSAIGRIIAWLAISAATVTLAFISVTVIMRLGLKWLDPDIKLKSVMTNETLFVIEMILGLLFVLLISPVVATRLFYGYKYRITQNGEKLILFTDSAHFIKKNRWAKAAIYALIIVCGFFFIPPKYQQIKLAIADGGRSTMIMAHRGDSASAPENTLPAFANAVAHGADAIELDVQMTKDGTIVCMHDSSLKRTTGVKKKIWEVTYDEIRDLDNGSFFNSSYRFTRIPTLDQALKLVKDKSFVNIEIKRTGHDEGIVEKTLEIVAANHFENDCDITSQDYETLKDVKKINPDIYTVYTTAVGGGDISKLKAANAFSIEENFVTAGLVSYLRKENKGIFVWTVNSESEINRMIDLGVDAIITNNVSMGVNLLETNQGVIGILHRIQRVLLAG